MRFFHRSSSLYKNLPRMLSFLKNVLSPSLILRRSTNFLSCFQDQSREYADKPNKPRTDVPSKQVVPTGNDNVQRLRVRRARPSDSPKVLRFVREHSRTAWPSLVSASVAPSAASQLILADYVARILAQGHTMVAEQMEAKQGWLSVKGLALGASICPWDAAVLERWAKCMRDKKSRKLIHFTAHCLKGPGLHDKYRVHKMLQVVLIVPPESLTSSEIVNLLAKNAIQRGREAGFPLLRFDVTNDVVAKVLEELSLHKEWHLSYDVLPDILDKTDKIESTSDKETDKNKKDRKGSFFAVYTAKPEKVASG